MTKDAVLKILLRDKGFVSGEAMSIAAGVSRAAVNAAVKSLKADGCVIESVTNKGYRLISCPDKLFAGDICSYLDDGRESSVICLPTVDSTNNRMKELLKDNPVAGTCIIANEQTGGRGRMGRSFVSPSGTGIYLSYLMRPNTSLADLSEITCWTAVAVHNAILNAYGISTDIKWVNDLYLGGRKITGILTELSIEGEVGIATNVIIGIGVNVNHRPGDFPPELADIATSIASYSGQAHLNRAVLAAEMIKALDKMSAEFPSAKSTYLDTYRANCLTADKDVDVINYATGDRRKGHALAVNDDFTLSVRYEDGSVEDVRSGEVSVRNING